jgi:hypothetical protein
MIIHEKRTDLAEKKLELLELEIEQRDEANLSTVKDLHKKIEPIHEHVIIVNAVVKYMIPTIFTVLAFFYKFNIFKF